MKSPETAKRLRMAMELRDVKAQELADRTGIHKSSISQYVNGSHAPSNISAGKMGEVLDVNPVWLMGLDAPMLNPLQIAHKPHKYCVFHFPFHIAFHITQKSDPLPNRIRSRPNRRKPVPDL